MCEREVATRQQQERTAAIDAAHAHAPMPHHPPARPPPRLTPQLTLGALEGDVGAACGSVPRQRAAKLVAAVDRDLEGAPKLPKVLSLPQRLLLTDVQAQPHGIHQVGLHDPHILQAAGDTGAAGAGGMRAGMGGCRASTEGAAAESVHHAAAPPRLQPPAFHFIDEAACCWQRRSSARHSP